MGGFRMDPREHQCIRRCDKCTAGRAKLILVIIASIGDPENIQITGLSAGTSDAKSGAHTRFI